MDPGNNPDRIRPYIPLVCQAADLYGIRRSWLAGLVIRESGATWAGPYTPKGNPRGTGDRGHGHGLCQIDNRTWGEWLRTHDWGDPLTNLKGACWILLQTKGYLRSIFSMPGVPPLMFWRTVLAAYNAGPSKARIALVAGGNPDTYTAHGNYSQGVLDGAAELEPAFPELIQPPVTAPLAPS